MSAHSSPRILAIDYGAKRFGLAYGDELGMALPIPALTRGDEDTKLEHLKRLIKERQINHLVLGLPTMLDGSEGIQAEKVKVFAARLRNLTGLPVSLVDERLTSKSAESLLGRNLKKSRQERGKGIVDSASAALFLQDYLDAKGLGNLPAPY